MSNELIIGLDVSKRFHVACSEGQKKAFKFNHDHAGFQSFHKYVSERSKGKHVVCALEPTGAYSGILAQWVEAQGWEVRIIPGSTTKRERLAYNGSSLKTDAKDALLLAMIAKDKNKYRPYRAHDKVVFELRDLSETYVRVNKLWVDALNQTHGLVDVLFPEMTSILNMKTRAPRELLKAYPNPMDIAAEDSEKFKTFMLGVSKGKLKIEKINALQKAAQETLGGYSSSIHFELKMQLDLLDQCEKHRNELEALMEKNLAQFDYAENLKSLPGVGPVVAAVLIGQLGDLRNYDSAKKLIKACGLNLIEHSSGKHVGRTRISYMGSPIVRRYLFQAAVVAISKKNSVFRGWFDDMKDRNKANNVVIVAGMRKLLKIAHAIARDNVPFDASRLNTPETPDNTSFVNTQSSWTQLRAA